ncbi:hypothetical protein B0H13DRAFT_1918897 [Mycena leptocephala]|nr:hypothetical protein B0H13DRAFT_1918897 [Mycena leptocephala]
MQHTIIFAGSTGDGLICDGHVKERGNIFHRGSGYQLSEALATFGASPSSMQGCQTMGYAVGAARVLERTERGLITPTTCGVGLDECCVHHRYLSPTQLLSDLRVTRIWSCHGPMENQACEPRAPLLRPPLRSEYAKRIHGEREATPRCTLFSAKPGACAPTKKPGSMSWQDAMSDEPQVGARRGANAEPTGSATGRPLTAAQQVAVLAMNPERGWVRNAREAGAGSGLLLPVKKPDKRVSAERLAAHRVEPAQSDVRIQWPDDGGATAG